MEIDSKKLKNWLKRRIKETKGLNQQIIADKINISQPYLNEILNDNKSGSFDILNKIADAVGVSLKHLILELEAEKGETKIIPENEEEEQLLIYFRGLDSNKRFLLMSIALDYYRLCTLIKEGKITEDE